MLSRLPACSLGLLCLLSAGSLAANDYFLTIGGGYSPSGNQVSLEKNVLMFNEILAESYPDGAAHNIFFADGRSASRDLQYQAPESETPRLNLYLARLMNQTRELGYRYRNSEIPGVDGPSSRESIARWFQEQGSKLSAGDRLLIYATAHGGRTRNAEQEAYNTRLFLWNHENYTVREFVEQLDKLDPQVEVVLVMVQCYAGGFANVIFEEGDEKSPPTAANRAGFFATVHDRVAAGCTPDVNEENYHEYSTYFWEALRGKTRTGRPIEPPDYDGDGRVSFEEAHAYALIHSPSIDISIKTSDRFLRLVSKPADEEHSGPHSIDSPYEELLAAARPAERAVLEALSAELELADRDPRGAAAGELAEQLQEQKKQLDERIKKTQGEFNAARDRIRRALLNSWPELANIWNPPAQEYLAREGDRIQQLIEAHESFSDFMAKAEQLDRENAEKLDIDRRWAKCRRLIRTLENVALALNLPHVADEDAQQRYEQLLLSESGTFGQGSQSAAP